MDRQISGRGVGGLREVQHYISRVHRDRDLKFRPCTYEECLEG